jgi:hypothetical protein
MADLLEESRSGGLPPDPDEDGFAPPSIEELRRIPWGGDGPDPLAQ